MLDISSHRIAALFTERGFNFEYIAQTIPADELGQMALDIVNYRELA